MIRLLHNPHCSKSREALALLNQRVANLEVVDYQETPLSLPELQALRALLNLPARALLRSGEAVYQTLGLSDQQLGDDALLGAIAEHPILLQRPIVLNGARAVIARPPELALTVL